MKRVVYRIDASQRTGCQKDTPSPMKPNQRVNEYKQLQAVARCERVCSALPTENAAQCPLCLSPFPSAYNYPSHCVVHGLKNNVEQIKYKIPPLHFLFLFRLEATGLMLAVQTLPSMLVLCLGRPNYDKRSSKSGEETGTKLTRINLPHLRQGQPDLIPVQRRRAQLQRVALKVDRSQVLLVAQLALHLGKVRDQVVASPEFLELRQRGEPGEGGDLVVGHLEDAQARVLGEAREGLQRIVRDVELLELGHLGERGEVADAVGLDGQEAEVGEAREASQGGDFVLGDPELLEGGEGVEVLQLADAVGAELEVADLGEARETLDLGDLVGNEVEVGKVGQVRDVFDVFDLVEREVEGCEVDEVVEAADV